MSTARSLRNKIIPSAVETAKINAAKPARMVKYLHAGERIRMVTKQAYLAQRLLRTKT